MAGPEKEFRSGAIKATVWKNEVEFKGVKTDVFKITLTKSYKDKNGEWKDTNKYTMNDALKAAELLRTVANQYNIEEVKRD